MRKTPLVLGALSIVFGVITAALMTFAVLAAPPSDAGSAERRYQVMSTTTFAVLALLLIVVGIGLARRRRWSRGAGIAWAIAALAVVELQFYIFGKIAESRTLGMYVTLAVESIFPLTMFVLLARRSAKDDFV